MREAKEITLDQATDRWMATGLVLFVLLVAVFPVYRWLEPGQREDRREAMLAGLATQGEDLYRRECADCHDLDGSIGTGPVLASVQFLASADDAQIRQLVAVGVPGTDMSAFSLDFGGQLTSVQIRAIVTYLRSLEESAGDMPGWREPRSP